MGGQIKEHICELRTINQSYTVNTKTEPTTPRQSYSARSGSVESPISAAVCTSGPTTLHHSFFIHLARGIVVKSEIPRFQTIHKNNHEIQSLLQTLNIHSTRRHHFLLHRKAKLQTSHVHCQRRVLQQLYKNRLDQLRLKTRAEYLSRTAHLRRSLILQMKSAECSIHVERAHSIAILHQMKKFHALRNTLSLMSRGLVDGLEEEEMEESLEVEEGVFEADVNPTRLFLQDNHAVNFGPLNQSEYDDSSLSLQHAFGHSIPIPTKERLDELDINRILTRLQIRHNMIFSADISFKPNEDESHVAARTLEVAEFWEELEQDVHREDGYIRIAALLNEIKEIMMTLVVGRGAEELARTMDISFLKLQLKRGTLDVGPIVTFLHGLLKDHCSPCRDVLVDSMRALFLAGNLVQGLRCCFEVLELMKLDMVNHHLRRIRPFVLESVVEVEFESFRSQLSNNLVTIHNTFEWLQSAEKSLCKATTAAESTHSNFLHRAFLSLVEHSEQMLVPETFQMDMERLEEHFNDWQDVAIVGSLMFLFRQFSGKNITSAALTSMSENLHVFMADTDTSVDHVALELISKASQLRGTKMNEVEVNQLKTIVDATISMDSKVYQIMWNRVRNHFLHYFATGTLDDAELTKNGLFESKAQLEGLSAKMKTLLEHNTSVHGSLYARILQTIRTPTEPSQ